LTVRRSVQQSVRWLARQFQPDQLGSPRSWILVHRLCQFLHPGNIRTTWQRSRQRAVLGLSLALLVGLQLGLVLAQQSVRRLVQQSGKQSGKQSGQSLGLPFQEHSHTALGMCPEQSSQRWRCRSIPTYKCQCHNQHLHRLARWLVVRLVLRLAQQSELQSELQSDLQSAVRLVLRLAQQSGLQSELQSDLQSARRLARRLAMRSAAV